MLFMVVVGVASKGCYYGLGAKDERLNEYLVEKSKLVSLNCPPDRYLIDLSSHTERIAHLALPDLLLLFFGLHQSIDLRHAPSNRSCQNPPDYYMGYAYGLMHLYPHCHYWPFCHVPSCPGKLG